MEDATSNGILARYPHASAFQRWHMRGRLHLCPYDALVKHLTGAKTLLDVGCGFGHLAWYLKQIGSPLHYYGTDIDPRKIALAQGSLQAGAGRTKPTHETDPVFRLGDVRSMDGLPDRFGNIVFLDVIYLMSWPMQQEFLAWAMERIADGPDSAVIVKTMDAAEGFSGFRAVAEEWIMVSLLRRTVSSGALNGARPLEDYISFAKERGFRCEVEKLPTFNPSSILRMHR